MKKLIVCVYDKKTKTWSDLISCPNLPTSTRMAEQMVANQNGIYAKYPGDFDLYKVGETVEDDDGHLSINVITPYEFICSFSDFVKETN